LSIDFFSFPNCKIIYEFQRTYFDLISICQFAAGVEYLLLYNPESNSEILNCKFQLFQCLELGSLFAFLHKKRWRKSHQALVVTLLSKYCDITTFDSARILNLNSTRRLNILECHSRHSLSYPYIQFFKCISVRIIPAFACYCLHVSLIPLSSFFKIR
jgi:hypothetical protein